MRLTVPTFNRQGEETSMQKPWHRIALATALVAALGTAPAFAGGPTKASDTKANDTKASSPSASPSMSAGDFVARHTMTGERSEEHTSELQSPCNLVCRLLLEKKKKAIVEPVQQRHQTCQRPARAA